MSDPVVLKQLVDISQLVGRRIPHWTQGPGGNISMKHVDRDCDDLWIKSSGKRLSDVQLKTALSCVILTKTNLQIKKLLVQKDLTVQQGDIEYEEIVSGSVGSTEFARPSMEIGFHALLPKKYVIHFHPIVGTLLASPALSHNDVFSEWFHAFQKTTRIYIAPFLTPGFELTKALVNVQDYDILVLQNHGVILQGDSPDMILNKWTYLEQEYSKTMLSKNKQDLLALSYEQLIDRYQKVPFKIKLYLPDVVVFFERIKNIVRDIDNSEETFLLQPDITDQNALEVCLFVAMLYEIAPNLEEIPRELADSISAQPLELFRKKEGNYAK